MLSWLMFNTLCALPLALLALVVRRVPRVGPGAEHFLWLLVLVRLVLPPLGVVDVVVDVAVEDGLPAVVSSAAPSLGDSLVASTTRLLGRNWSTWVGNGLLVLFLVLLARVAVRELLRARMVERCVRRADPVRGRLQHRVQRLARALRVPVPSVRISPEISGPFLWSLRSPVLVLPAVERVPDRTVLAHELAHLSRRDHWTSWLELAVQAFHFWNPLFWLARRQLHRTAELACDRRVLERFPARRRAFAAALLETAERSAGGFVPRAAQAIGMDPRDFEERLVRILGPDEPMKALPGILPLGILCGLLTLPGWVAPSLGAFRAALPELPSGIDRVTWQRSLDRARERLADNPSDGTAVMVSGMALLGLGRHQEAIEAFRLQAQLGHEPARASYNLACAWTLLGDHDEAFASLGRAAELGIDVRALAARDPDLADLRSDPRLQALGGEPGQR